MGSNSWTPIDDDDDDDCMHSNKLSGVHVNCVQFFTWLISFISFFLSFVGSDPDPSLFWCNNETAVCGQSLESCKNNNNINNILPLIPHWGPRVGFRFYVLVNRHCFSEWVGIYYYYKEYATTHSRGCLHPVANTPSSKPWPPTASRPLPYYYIEASSLHLDRALSRWGEHRGRPAPITWYPRCWYRTRHNGIPLSSSSTNIPRYRWLASFSFDIPVPVVSTSKGVRKTRSSPSRGLHAKIDTNNIPVLILLKGLSPGTNTPESS